MGTLGTLLVGFKKVSLVTQNLILFRNQKYVNELCAIKKSTRTTSPEMIFHKYTKNLVVTWSITKNDIHFLMLQVKYAYAFLDNELKHTKWK